MVGGGGGIEELAGDSVRGDAVDATTARGVDGGAWPCTAVVYALGWRMRTCPTRSRVRRSERSGAALVARHEKTLEDL